jgi:hypothetical protein
MRFVMRGDAEAAPGFGDDDAVGGIVEVVTDLDGQIGADVADVIGEGGNVLGALVGDAGDAVVVDEKAWGVGGVVRGKRRVGDGSVGDATHGGEQVAAAAFDLFRGGLFAGKQITGSDRCGRCGHCNGGYSSRRPQGQRQMVCDGREHGSCPTE